MITGLAVIIAAMTGEVSIRGLINQWRIMAGGGAERWCEMRDSKANWSDHFANMAEQGMQVIPVTHIEQVPR